MRGLRKGACTDIIERTSCPRAVVLAVVGEGTDEMVVL